MNSEVSITCSEKIQEDNIFNLTKCILNPDALSEAQ